VNPRMPGRLSDRHEVKVRLRQAGLHTVCEEARCPNMGECFRAGTATFLILGDACTRRCGFCAVSRDRAPLPPDADEPRRVAEAVQQLGLDHAVITSVTRDDLPDGGADLFAACIRHIRSRCPGTSVEVLVPDFRGDERAVAVVLHEHPDVFNHNVETVPRLYPEVRPGADFSRSLRVLTQAASTGVVVKSGLMVGLGESEAEVGAVLADLRAAGCQWVTVGQYLRPVRDRLRVARQVEEEEYTRYRTRGESLGLRVVAGPLVRSSFRAAEVWGEMKGS